MVCNLICKNFIFGENTNSSIYLLFQTRILHNRSEAKNRQGTVASTFFFHTQEYYDRPNLRKLSGQNSSSSHLEATAGPAQVVGDANEMIRRVISESPGFEWDAQKIGWLDTHNPTKRLNIIILNCKQTLPQNQRRQNKTRREPGPGVGCICINDKRVEPDLKREK